MYFEQMWFYYLLGILLISIPIIAGFLDMYHKIPYMSSFVVTLLLLPIILFYFMFISSEINYYSRMERINEFLKLEPIVIDEVKESKIEKTGKFRYFILGHRSDNKKVTIDFGIMNPFDSPKTGEKWKYDEFGDLIKQE